MLSFPKMGLQRAGGSSIVVVPCLVCDLLMSVFVAILHSCGEIPVALTAAVPTHSSNLLITFFLTLTRIYMIVRQVTGLMLKS